MVSREDEERDGGAQSTWYASGYVLSEWKMRAESVVCCCCGVVGRFNADRSLKLYLFAAEVGAARLFSDWSAVHVLQM